MSWKFGLGKHVVVNDSLCVVISRECGEYELKICGVDRYYHGVRAKCMEEVIKIEFIYTGKTDFDLEYGEKYIGYLCTNNGRIYLENGENFRYEYTMSPKQFETLQKVEFVCVKEPVETRHMRRPVFIGRKCHLIPTKNYEPFLLLRDEEPRVSEYLSKPLVEFDEYFYIDEHEGHCYQLHNGHRLDRDWSFWIGGDCLERITGHHILCPTCGEFTRPDDLKIVGKSLVCPECANDIVTSWISGEPIPRRAARKINTHEGTKYVYWSEWADEILYPDDDPEYAYKEGVMFVDGHLFTEAYVNEKLESGEYIKCSRCGNIFPASNVIETDDGEYICNNCMDDYIGEYHSSPVTTFISSDEKSMRLFGNEPFFGVEHELGYVGRENNKLAYTLTNKFNRHCEHDSSVPKGFEVISQPMTFDRWKNENMAEYMALLKENGYDDSDETGIHVHISTQNLNKHGIAEICQFVYENYNALIKFGRRNPDVTGYFQYINLTDPFLNDEFIIDTNNSSRYHAVNTRHLDEKNIELRFFASTNDESHFWAILEFCYCLEKSAEKGSVNWDTITQIAEEDGRCENFLKEVNDKFDNDWTSKYYYCVDEHSN
jgi:hypothetical protein